MIICSNLRVVKTTFISPNSVGGVFMRKQEKDKIIKLRMEGLGYGKIATILNLPKSTISSFCKTLDQISSVCLLCGTKLKQTAGHRQKKFCSNNCKLSYYKQNKNEIRRRPNYEVDCACCHHKFFTYKSLNRKYCSWDCFLKSKAKRGSNG